MHGARQDIVSNSPSATFPAGKKTHVRPGNGGTTEKCDEPSTLKVFADSHDLNVLVLLDGITRNWVGPGPYNCKSKTKKPKGVVSDVSPRTNEQTRRRGRNTHLRDHEPDGEGTSQHPQQRPQQWRSYPSQSVTLFHTKLSEEPGTTHSPSART